MNDRPPPYDTIVFDCDSTLSAIEGIDELAALTGIDVSDLTRRAMDGELALEEVYGLRLERIRPTRAALERIGELYVDRVLPNAGALVRALRFLEKRVCVVSGGLLPAVARVAAALGVAEDDVFAVGVELAPDGTYADFDRSSPLARSGGKPAVLREIGSPGAPGEPSVCLIGDGITDLEAAPEVARFVAFGGVERRAAVFDKASASCDRADLAALVPLLLTAAEIERLAGVPEHAPLVAAALR